MTPQIHILISGTYEYVNLFGKKDQHIGLN